MTDSLLTDDGMTPEEQEAWDNIDIDQDPPEDAEEDMELPTEDSTKTKQTEVTKKEDEEDDIDWNRSFKTKAAGKDVSFTLHELVHTLAPKAHDYTRKLQQIAPYRKMISAMEEGGISQEDINLFIDMKKGDKTALAKFVKEQKVDVLDVDTGEAEKYSPKDYGLSEEQLNIKEAIEDLKRSPHRDKIIQIADNEWDTTSRQELFASADLLRALEGDLGNGSYDVIAPEAQRRKILDGAKKSDLSYYKEAAVDYNKYLQSVAFDQQYNQTPTSNNLRTARKNATITRTQTRPSVTDMLQDELNSLPNDEQYKEWLRNIGDTGD